MIITFLLRDKTKILDFELLNTEKIQNVHVYNEILAKGVLRYQELNIRNLLNLLRYYKGGNSLLNEYINHIKEYGFYSPYQPNLRIKISKKIQMNKQGDKLNEN